MHHSGNFSQSTREYIGQSGEYNSQSLPVREYTGCNGGPGGHTLTSSGSHALSHSVTQRTGRRPREATGASANANVDIERW